MWHTTYDTSSWLATYKRDPTAYPLWRRRSPASPQARPRQSSPAAPPSRREGWSRTQITADAIAVCSQAWSGRHTEESHRRRLVQAVAAALGVRVPLNPEPRPQRTAVSDQLVHHAPHCTGQMVAQPGTWSTCREATADTPSSKSSAHALQHRNAMGRSRCGGVLAMPPRMLHVCVCCAAT